MCVSSQIFKQHFFDKVQKTKGKKREKREKTKKTKKKKKTKTEKTKKTKKTKRRRRRSRRRRISEVHRVSGPATFHLEFSVGRGLGGTQSFRPSGAHGNTS